METKTERERHLHAVRVLVDCDLKHGSNNEKAIQRHIEKEEYEELAVIKEVFDEHNVELPI